jgi:hypothetical protein
MVSAANPRLAYNTIAENGSSDSGDGVWLFNVGRVEITGNVISGQRVGIGASGSSQAVLARNDLWQNNADYVGIQRGATDLAVDPQHVSGPIGRYYLSQRAAGQRSTSPLVDAGQQTAAEVGLDEVATRTDGVPDRGLVDLGVHYFPFTGQPRQWFPMVWRGR